VKDYLGRYTHRVAISNHRLLDIEGGSFVGRIIGTTTSRKSYPAGCSWPRELLRR
jgi:hypothetical protein